MRSALVTGANGFIGRQVCRTLLARDWRVVGQVRTQAAVDGLVEGAEPRLVAATHSADEWRLAMHAADVVVHLIGMAHRSGSEEEYRSTNVEITAAVADAASSLGSHLVYMSSVRAAGSVSAQEPLTESAPPNPSDSYGVSKLAAERSIRAAVSRTGGSATVLRPPLVYGPEVTANFLRLMTWVDRERPLPLGQITSKRSVVFVENLADGVATVAEHRPDGMATYYIADDVPLSPADLARRLAHHLDRKVRMLPVPVPLLRLLGRVTGRSSDIHRLVDSLVVSSDSLRADVGWSPPFTTDDGLARTASWYADTRNTSGSGRSRR